MKKIDKRRFIYSMITGLVFALFFVVGKQLNDDNVINFGIITAINIVIVTAILSVVFYRILIVKNKIKADNNYKITWLKIFIPLIIISIFFLIAIYPGNYGYDSPAQYHRFYVGKYGTHFPAIFCWLLGVFLTLGKNIFGNFEAGLFVLLLLQSIFINFVIAKIVTYVGNKIQNKKFTIILVLYFLLHPLSQVLILSSCHDVPFGGFFALLVLEFLKMVEEDDYFSKKSNYLKVGTITILMCLFRNNGFFALIPAVVVGLIVMKKKRVNLAIIMLVPMLLFQVWNQVFMNFISVDNQSLVHESLNVPIMQIARALYYNHPQTWSEELNTYFNVVCDWRRYGEHSGISDNFKSCLKDEYIESHLFEFIGYWAKLGIKAPHRYIEAPGALALGLYYPWKTYPEDAHHNADTYHPYVEFNVVDYSGHYDDIGVAPMHRYPVIPTLSDFLKSLTDGQEWSKIYGFRLIWCGAFSTFLMLFSVFFALYRKQKEYLLPISLIFGLILTVFLAPVVLFRYLFPVVLTTPIMLYIILKCVSAKR